MVIYVILCDTKVRFTPQSTHLRASVWLLKTSLLFFWSIHANLIWLEYFGYEVQFFENDDTANVESIHKTA